MKRVNSLKLYFSFIYFYLAEEEGPESDDEDEEDDNDVRHLVSVK